MNEKPGYWSRLLAALLGRRTAPPSTGSAAAVPAGLEARIAGLEMDVRERDERIGRMQAEYEQLHVARDRAAGDAGRDELEKLFKKLAGPWASVLALAAMAEAGQNVQAGDLVQLIKDVEKALARAGLESIGRAGERTTFDVAHHQRMSGGTVHTGTPVTVRVPGFRTGEKVLAKALVSTREQ
jgi:molecular chaperone GrpE (heat shock protein)